MLTCPSMSRRFARIMGTVVSLSLAWALTPAQPVFAESASVEPLTPSAFVTESGTPETMPGASTSDGDAAPSGTDAHGSASWGAQPAETTQGAQSSETARGAQPVEATQSAQPAETAKAAQGAQSAEASLTSDGPTARDEQPTEAAETAQAAQSAETAPFSDGSEAQDTQPADAAQDAQPTEGSLPAEDTTPDPSEGALMCQSTDPIETIVASMTLDEKISQMIVPSIDRWSGQGSQDLGSSPAVAEALRRHQYGGIILFDQNIASVAQTATLVNDLQANNWRVATSNHIPYLMMLDNEGGVVTRLTMGTRMVGNMAIAATGANAEANARTSGRILGEEAAALGFNANFAPILDVNTNPANPVIGTRSFSDDPGIVAKLGIAFMDGVEDAGMIATVKHFPGHGDTNTDSHTGLPTIDATLAELEATELAPFRAAIEADAELIMTAHITLPKVDDARVFPDGSTGYYPATMSRKIMTDILRGQLGYDGVIITDGLEMAAIAEGNFVEGEPGSVEYAANVAREVINAGVDILLIPLEITDADSIEFMDGYIEAIATKVKEGEVDEARIDESVGRILTLKRNHGLNVNEPAPAADAARAAEVIGSTEHHAIEMEMARQAITLLKNDDHTLPASGHGKRTVILSFLEEEASLPAYAVSELQRMGLIDADAYVSNLVTKTASGSPDSATQVTLDYYIGTDEDGEHVVHYTDELSKAVREADLVVCITSAWSSYSLSARNAPYQAVTKIKAETHEMGGKFALLSTNLPYDAARYPDADAIVLGYMGAALDTDPTSRGSGSNNQTAFNANVVAAIEALFDHMPPTGTLPVHIPVVNEEEDGSVSYSEDAMAYQRGFGLTYEYVVIEGDGGSHAQGMQDGLAFTFNARHDRLVRVLVDGEEVDASRYAVAPGSTVLTLTSGYLDTLAPGDHTLTGVWDYDGREVQVDASFKVVAKPDEGDRAGQDDAKPKPASDQGQSQAPRKDQSPNQASSAAAPQLPSTADEPLPVVPLTLAALIATCGGVALQRRRRRDERSHAQGIGVVD